jgi:subtilase family serine protease
MFRRQMRKFCTGTLALVALMMANSPLATVLAAPALPPVATTHVPACPGPAAPGFARCHALVRTDTAARAAVPARSGGPVTPDVLGNGGAYDPAYLQSAYNLQSAANSAGAGRTVAIVDAYDAPNAESDLASYRSFFGLPTCTSTTGCFRKVDQFGGTNFPGGNAGWAQDISLDLDMVSAVCPNCSILLVEARSNSLADLVIAVDYAASVSAVVAISNSYSSGEWSGETGLDSHYNHPGVAITASSGDNGYGVQFPAASRFVTAVGGTTLNQLTNAGTRSATETVWSGAGSGCSAYELKPTWQVDRGCPSRTVADVAAVADPNTGVWVRYNSAWYIFGGTSVASPIVASVYALAGSSRATSASPAAYPYGDARGLFDISIGSNGSCSGNYLCTGATGYDGPTGLGTPNGPAAFAATAVQPDYALAIGPTSQSVVVGSSTTYSVGLTASGTFNSPVNLAVSGLPAGATGTFNPGAVTPTSAGASSTLTVATGADTPTGSYTVTITAVGTDPGTIAHSAMVTLTASAPKPDFTLIASALTVSKGGTGTSTIRLTSANGYGSSVALSVVNPPRGVAAIFAPASVALPNQTMSALTLTLSQSAKPGTQTLTVMGTGLDGTIHTTSLLVTVQ